MAVIEIERAALPDTLHHMPVARRAALASSFGLRFQGEGYFLTDARSHRGTSLAEPPEG